MVLVTPIPYLSYTASAHASSSMLTLRVVRQLGEPPSVSLQARFDAGGTVGRSPDCTLVLPDPARHISREQARIDAVAGGYTIRCTGSASAIVLNGREIGPGESAPLRAGDSLVIAEYELLVEVPAAAPSAGPAARPSVVDDPFAALGMAPMSSPPDDPLGGFGLPGGAVAAAATGRDPLGLGGLPPATPDPARVSGDSLDALFDLSGASPDPLGLSSGLSGPLSQPNTAASADPLASLGMQAAPGLGAQPDHSPEIAGSFRLPEAIPATDFGFGLPTPDAAPRPAPAPVAARPGARAAVPAPVPGALPNTASFLSWEKPEEISPTITISQIPALGGVGADPDAGRAVSPPMPEPLAPEQIRAIADEIAERHRVDFEPPPKTRPTEFLDQINRAQLDALRAGGTREKPAREAAVVSEDDAAALDAARFELLKALLLGLGLTELPRSPLATRGGPPQLTPELMRRLGELVRVATQGTIDLLQARATLKREMKTEVTLIATRDNNPLKFSPDAQAALAHLLSSQSIRGFLDPVPALKDSYDDLLAHQVGFIAGMRAAMQGLIARFDPSVLETRLTRKSVLDAMLPGSRKARLWELFGELYAEISREAEDDFEALFGREFVKAYEQQVARLDPDKN